MIADARRPRRGQAAQRQDEKNRRYQIKKRCEILAHKPLRYFRRWNICSMRWVTMKPPKILTAARTTATNPMNLAKPNTARPGSDQCAHDDNTRNRVRDTHQRRMQRRGHSPNHVITDKHREHENRQLIYERWAAHRSRPHGGCLETQLMGHGLQIVREPSGVTGEPAGPLGQRGGVCHSILRRLFRHRRRNRSRRKGRRQQRANDRPVPGQQGRFDDLVVRVDRQLALLVDDQP